MVALPRVALPSWNLDGAMDDGGIYNRFGPLLEVTWPEMVWQEVVSQSLGDWTYQDHWSLSGRLRHQRRGSYVMDSVVKERQCKVCKVFPLLSLHTNNSHSLPWDSWVTGGRLWKFDGGKQTSKWIDWELPYGRTIMCDVIKGVFFGEGNVIPLKWMV